VHSSVAIATHDGVCWLASVIHRTHDSPWYNAVSDVSAVLPVILFVATVLLYNSERLNPM